MGRLPTIFTNFGDDKHVVIPIEFAKDESSILSTSNKQGQQKLAFFIGGEQGNSLPCVRESSWERCFLLLQKTARDRRPGRLEAKLLARGLLSTSIHF